MEVKCIGRNFAEPQRFPSWGRNWMQFSKGGGMALSEPGDQWVPGAIPVVEASIGAVVPSSLHMIQYLSMWDVWYPSVVGWPWLAAKVPPVAHSLSSLRGREERIGRSGMRKFMCCNEDREINFSYHHGQNGLDLRKMELIYCQLIMYLINFLGTGRPKANTKTLRESIFPSPFSRFIFSCYHYRLSPLSKAKRTGLMASVEQFSPAAPFWSRSSTLWCGSYPAAGNITSPNHQVTQDSVLQTGHSGGTGPCAERHMEQQPQEETGRSVPGDCPGPCLSGQVWVWRCSAHGTIWLSIINHFKYLKSSAVMTAQVINYITFNRPFKQRQVSDICYSVEYLQGRTFLIQWYLKRLAIDWLKMAMQRIKCFSRLLSSSAYCSAKKMTIHPLTGGWFNCNLLLKAHNPSA